MPYGERNWNFDIYSFVLGGNIERSSSLPIVPLTPGGLLIPFQPSHASGIGAGPLSQAVGHPSNLRNFNDIQRRIQQQRALIDQNLRQQQQRYDRIPSPPVISTGPGAARGPYAAGNSYNSPRMGRTAFPSGAPSTYGRPPSIGVAYSQPSYAGSNAGSIGPSSYRPLR